MLCMQIKVVQFKKKGLKALAPTDSDHWGIHAYQFLSFLFSVLHKVFLCLPFLTVCRVCSARPRANEVQRFLGLAGLPVGLRE